VDRSDFLQALKYMNLLQGASRKIAGEWMKEARLMLETQQAANTLMAHAAAKARNYFIDEIESIFPGLSLADKKLNLSKEDLDLFILHAYTHVLAYQKELQRLQTDGELRLKRAIDSVRGDNDSEALRAQLEYHLEAERRKLAVENQKKIFHIHAESDKLLRLQLKKQAEAHADHIKDIVAQRETDLTRSFKRELEDKLATEKANYKLQLAGMLGKLRGMDAALAGKLYVLNDIG